MQQKQREVAIAQLQQRIRACRLCEEHGYIPKAQPLTSGRASDRIMVIGQAPGHRSVANGRSFSGPGGRILQKWLEQAGFPPGYLHSHAYLSSLTHCDPGRNPRGDGDRRPSPQEVALCRPFLEAELQLLQPKVVLLVGSMAIETFWGRVKLEDVIGTCHIHLA
ncbi:MAG: uracil-DNA glycosylase [Chloroflexi bacterium]|nr:MAG: uracil-DNA glycosylase [Chloroflexota bacterium]